MYPLPPRAAPQLPMPLPMQQGLRHSHLLNSLSPSVCVGHQQETAKCSMFSAQGPNLNPCLFKPKQHSYATWILPHPALLQRSPCLRNIPTSCTTFKSHLSTTWARHASAAKGSGGSRPQPACANGSMLNMPVLGDQLASLEACHQSVVCTEFKAWEVLLMSLTCLNLFYGAP